MLSDILEVCFPVPWLGSQLSLLALQCFVFREYLTLPVLTTSIPSLLGDLFASMYYPVRNSHILHFKSY